ncbi:pseudouridylate synthase 7 homolog isoform X2 [Planococcus citri]|uniref:pseudouridylate synthase 7 homolog isoform X2 n=1 Tax=Planococcus citri TaxID=170843 RepID=UPI0031F78B51
MPKRKLEDCDEDSEEVNPIFTNLTEKDVFISEYIDASCSFRGIIKQRFSDFQVNEIDLDGKIVELTSVDFKKNNKTDENNEEEKDPDVVDEELDIDVAPVKELTYPITSDDQWRQLTLLLKRGRKDETIKIEVTDVDKEGRTKIHCDIKTKYKNKLLTSTVSEKDDKKYILIGVHSTDKRNNCQRWPNDLPQYLYAVAFKENIDTMSVAQKITKKLRINPKLITYAGTKDRRGVTSQWISVCRVEAHRLASLSYQDKLCFGNFEYRKEPLQLGDLQGNRFRLALRNVESSSEDIEKTMKIFEKTGFINYFGLQRFGSYSTAPTYEIGKYLLTRQWKEAVNSILRTRPKNDEINDACKIWTETCNATEALKALRKNRDHSIEGSILQTLSTQGNTAFMNALQRLPRNMRLLYLHSFQSLIWNQIVSKRIREFGLKPLVGDLVYDTKNDMKDENSKKSVKVVTTDILNDVKIEDIVYPLPGSAITYPDNIIGEWYREIFKEQDIDFDQSGDGYKAFSLSGDYRKMIVIAKNVQWKSVYYNNINADLIATDYQRMKQSDSIENLDAGNFKAVILEFSLPSSTYATMALREITKMDTSASFQASLTLTHFKEKNSKHDLKDESMS